MGALGALCLMKANHAWFLQGLLFVSLQGFYRGYRGFTGFCRACRVFLGVDVEVCIIRENAHSRVRISSCRLALGFCLSAPESPRPSPSPGRHTLPSSETPKSRFPEVGKS